MSHNKFRLKNILSLRERERDAAAGSYKEALAAKAKLQSQVDELLQEHAQQMPIQSALNQGHIDTQRLIESQRYQLHLMQEVAELRGQIALIDGECEKRRRKLVTREQALSSLEKLRDKQQAEQTRRGIEREQIALDQWSSIKYWSDSQSL